MVANLNELHSEIARQHKQLIALRRAFHRQPELSFQEEQTSRQIADYLRKLGLEVQDRVFNTGVIGTIRGNQPGKTLLIRADIDALPIQEMSDVEYKSQRDGVMHACGHDGHIAIGLLTAEILARYRAALHGTVKVLFQPAEERIGGAKPMIEAGAMRNPTVDAVIGLHIWNEVAVGKVGVHAGALFASADEILLTVSGKGGHGAMPYVTIDPITIAAQIITALQTVVSRELSPFQPAILTIASIHGGTACNIIPDRVVLQGTVRAFDRRIRDQVIERIRIMSSSIAEAMRGKCVLELHASCPSVINNVEMVELLRTAIVPVVGEQGIIETEPISVSDDMAFFLESAPGCYFLLGSANPARGLSAPHHNARFDFDEACLASGVEIMTRAALTYLSRPR